MKIMTLLTISIVLFASIVIAQQDFHFVEESKTWSEITIFQEISYPYAQHIWTTSYKLEGDSIYNGKMYKNLYTCDTDPSVSVWSLNGWGYREESGKVYKIDYLFSETEELVYDFNLNVGDSIYCDSICYNAYDYVIAVDSVLIDGSYRKQIHFNDPADVWIEGLGSMHRPFDPIQYYFIIPNSFELLCVNEVTGNIYKNPAYNQCYVDTVTTGLHELTAASFQVTVQNNPMHDYSVITIGKSLNEPTEYILYDSRGVLLRTGILDDSTFIIRRENLNPGIYILKVFDKENVITRKLIIV